MDPTHLVDILRESARRFPEQSAFTFLEDGEAPGAHLTFGELDLRARRLAVALREQGAQGERVLLCHPAGLEYVVAFWGCMYAGAVAVPAFPPDPARPQRTLPRLRAVFEDSQAALALAPEALLPGVRELLAQCDPRARCLASDAVAGGEERWEPPGLSAEDVAFLMYTSGSTSIAKGATITHGNAADNVTAFHGFAERPCRTLVSWVPLFHDLGLVVCMLYPVYQGAHCVTMSPLAFMQRPLRWLQAISRYRATTTAAPNFAYELCVRRSRPDERAGLDLSCLNLALNGGEPVRAHTVERFTEAFAPHGFRREALYPAYGLSDATADASGSSRFRSPLLLRVDRRALERREVVRVEEGPGSVTLVGCGEALPGQRMRVVDPETCRRLPDDSVGEIWLSGPSVAHGYWRRGEQNERIFGARLAGEDDPHRYFRTGDLGFWHEGEIFVVGRMGDMLILHGVNHFPEDIEPVVERCHPALRAGGGAVFGVEIGGEERLVVLHEVQPERLSNPDEVFRAIRRAVGEHHELEVGEIALIAPGELLKTLSGKVRRKACRERLLAGEMRLFARWRSGP